MLSSWLNQVSILNCWQLTSKCKTSKRKCSKKCVLKNSQKNTCTTVSFLIKLQTSACKFIKKETLTLMFFCEYCEIIKITVFAEHLRATAPKNIKVFIEKWSLDKCCPCYQYVSITLIASILKWFSLMIFFGSKLSLCRCFKLATRKARYLLGVLSKTCLYHSINK